MLGLRGEIWVKPGQIIADGTLLIGEDGLIKAVLNHSLGEALASEEVVVKHYNNGEKILPGFIDPHTHLGICEEVYGFENLNETSQVMTPALKALDGIRFLDKGLEEACLRGGVTTVCVLPGSTNIIAGVGCVIKTKGKNPVMKEVCGLKVSLGSNPLNCFQKKGLLYTRMALVEALFAAFEEAETTVVTANNKWLKEALEGNLQVRVHAHRAEDIASAIKLKKRFALDLVVEHGTEGHLLLEDLKDNQIALIGGPFFVGRPKVEMANLNRKLVPLALAAGIQTGIMTDYPSNPPEMLKIAMLEMLKEGLTEDEALRMVTLTGAELLGLEKQVGSLEVGKDGDVVIHSKSPFEYSDVIKQVFIKGEEILWTNMY